MKKILSLTALFFLFNSSYAQNLPPYLPAAGLVAWYPFNGNTNDESGNGNHAVNFGASLTSDRLGVPSRAFSFNGSTNYITTPINSFNVNKISIGIWFKTNVWKNYAGMFCSRAGNNLLNGLELINENGSKRVFLDLMYNIDFHRTDYADSTLADSQWHFIAGTFNGSSMKLYLDGDLVSQLSVSFLLSVQDNFKIGTDDIFGTERSFQGDLDDAFIYNRDLTLMEIQQIYQGSLTEVTQVEPDTKILLSPNPTSGLFTVKSNGNIKGLSYFLSDQTGKTIYTGQLLNDATEFDITQLAPGIYHLQIGGNSIQFLTILKN